MTSPHNTQSAVRAPRRMAMADSAEHRKDLRLLAAKERRAGWTAKVEVEITVGDLVDGDFVVVVPTQHGVQGCRFERKMEICEADIDGGWQQGLWPIESRMMVPADGVSGPVVWNYPVSFKVTVRR